MTVSTLETWSPEASLATTSISLGPSVRVTTSEKLPFSSGVTKSLLTDTAASTRVWPVTVTVGVLTTDSVTGDVTVREKAGTSEVAVASGTGVGVGVTVPGSWFAGTKGSVDLRTSSLTVGFRRTFGPALTTDELASKSNVSTVVCPATTSNPRTILSVELGTVAL